MNVLGVRCSNKDFTYVVMSGSKKSPGIKVSGSPMFPPNYCKARSLQWLFREVSDLITKHNVKKIVMKRFEGKSRGNTYEDRVEHEAVVYLAAAEKGITGVFKKVNRTIAKDLGLKGMARYLQTSLDTSMIPKFKARSEKEQDAIRAAWSELN